MENSPINNLLYRHENCFEVKEQQHKEYVAVDKKNNKSEYRIKNKSGQTVSKIRADSERCIKEEGICDFVFTIGKTKYVEEYFLVELKDSDLTKATKQLEYSMGYFGLNKTKVSARVVLTRTYAPDIRDNRVKKFKDKIESGGGTFKHKSQYLEDII